MRRFRARGTAAALVAVLTAALCLACSPDRPAAGHAEQPSSAAPTPARRFDDVPLVPASGAYLGVYDGDGSPAETDDRVGRVPQVHLTYVGFHDAWATDPVLAQDAARGQISLVNWEPFGVDLADVVAGRYDRMLQERAAQAAGLTRPVLVDLAAEMNEEEGWGHHDPALYVAAYRHVHDVFAGHDGGHVVWVWAPNNVDSEGEPPALDYYPGDAYVDWTGIDGYNWGTSQPGFAWQSFEEVFSAIYDQLATLDKPMIIGETSSAEQGGSKAAWIDAVGPTIRDDFPDVRAVVWFDVDKERDWRIRSSAGSLAAFRRLAASEELSAPVR
ncbi:MAG TPA: glycosyl hydrolase [Friedmanniella sp.]